MTLKRSRSRKSTASNSPRRSARVRARARRSTKIARLGRPVRGSRKACRASWSSRRGELIDLVGLLLYGGEHLAEAAPPGYRSRPAGRDRRAGPTPWRWWRAARRARWHWRCPRDEPPTRRSGARRTGAGPGGRTRRSGLRRARAGSASGVWRAYVSTRSGMTDARIERDDDLPLDALPGKGDFPVQLFGAHHTSP